MIFTIKVGLAFTSTVSTHCLDCFLKVFSHTWAHWLTCSNTCQYSVSPHLIGKWALVFVLFFIFFFVNFNINMQIWQTQGEWFSMLAKKFTKWTQLQTQLQTHENKMGRYCKGKGFFSDHIWVRADNTFKGYKKQKQIRVRRLSLNLSFLLCSLYLIIMEMGK